jgi:Ribonuclease toxin, BrnT, of type II toxin-antitoxin system
MRGLQRSLLAAGGHDPKRSQRLGVGWSGAGNCRISRNLDNLLLRRILVQDDEFEWLDAKATRNWRNHDGSFEMARDVFKDTFAIEWADGGQDESEDRFVTVGMV